MEQFRIQALKESVYDILIISGLQLWLNFNFPPFMQLGYIGTTLITAIIVPMNIYLLAYADVVLKGLKIFVPGDRIASGVLTDLLRLFLLTLSIGLILYMDVNNVYRTSSTFYLIWNLFLIFCAITGYRGAIRINSYK